MLNGKVRLPFLVKIIVLIGLLTTVMLSLLGLLLNERHASTLEDEIGMRALSVAQAVSLIPEVQQAFAEEHPELTIQPIVERIRKEVGAEFIVVGNREGIRYSHPLPGRIGKTMVGGDNEAALNDGQAYVSEAIGSLGPSIRGKVPIYNQQGEIIGVVSVGFLVDHINTIIDDYQLGFWMFIVAMIAIGLLAAYLISYQLKKDIHGLEPEEIGRMFKERGAILESIHEGIIAVNQEGMVVMFNQAAKKFMEPHLVKGDIIGSPVVALIPNTRLPEVLETGVSQFNQELWIGDDLAIVNRIPIFLENRVVGAVSTFRSRKEIKALTEELSQTQSYADALRSQTHEFSNKLNTISGLLQLNEIKEAIEFINKEHETHQESIQFLIQRVKDPMVSAILLGKMNRAHEMGLDLTISEDSSLLTELTQKQQEALVTILGNILENAFEALVESNQESPAIYLAFTDLGNELLIEIEDNGPGIDPKKEKEVFKKGFSSKDGYHRGFGLHLVKKAAEEVGGTIFLEDGESGGACFVVTIPKANDLNGGVRR
ncbi:ATP-binding protein [Bacillus solitudinis]|uniref:ATP-binding protein n=1 Tax=Bacillus solitudinis TaxID=2014074 RepID=UPI000C23BD11|nr:sensor histidine kinase [Bacillus solitudinis]